MEITVEYSSVSRVKYEFNEEEVERALIEYVKVHYAERLLGGGVWSFEWWDEANDIGRMKFTGELTQVTTKEE